MFLWPSQSHSKSFAARSSYGISSKATWWGMISYEGSIPFLPISHSLWGAKKKHDRRVNHHDCFLNRKRWLLWLPQWLANTKMLPITRERVLFVAEVLLLLQVIIIVVGSTAQLRSLSQSVRARTATGQQRNNFMPNQPANLVAPRGEEGAEASGFGLASAVLNTNAFVVLLILFSHHACKHVNSCPLFLFYTIKLIKTVCLSWDWGWEYLL